LTDSSRQSRLLLVINAHEARKTRGLLSYFILGISLSLRFKKGISTSRVVNIPRRMLRTKYTAKLSGRLSLDPIEKSMTYFLINI
jgi:hypothetical protein